MSLHFPCQKFALFVFPFLNGHHCGAEIRNESHFPLPKIPRLSQMARAAPSFFSSKKWIKLILKTIRIEKKRLCVRLRSEDKHHLRKSADRKAQIRKVFVQLTGLICAFRSADFLRWCLSSERNLTHNLFSSPRMPHTLGEIFTHAQLLDFKNSNSWAGRG